MKLDDVSQNQNSLNYLLGVRLLNVFESMRSYCFVTELALKFSFNTSQVTHHWSAWHFDVLTPRACKFFLSCIALLLLLPQRRF